MFGRMLLRDRFALVAAIFLILVTVGALIGPYLFGDLATKVNLRQRNLPPFTLDNGFLYVLGADSLGRSLLARIIVGAQTSLAISACVVVASMLVGGTLGIVAGYMGGWTSTIIMRLTDIIFSFPSLLMALIVLYILGPSILNVILSCRSPGCRSTSARPAPRCWRSASGCSSAPRAHSAFRRPHILAPPHPAGRLPDDHHHRRRRLRLGAAGRIRPELPWPRHPAARLHLGCDGGDRPRLPADGVVAGVLARPDDHADDAVAEPAGQLGADGQRPAAALAPAARGAPRR